MNNKFFKLSMLAAIAMAANACDTGEYNNLDCDSDYVSECLTTDAYMFCNGNKLEVARCSNGQICVQTDAGHQCAPAVEDGCTSSSCNGNILKDCKNGISTTIDCSLTGQICNPTTFACEIPTEKCTASSCAPDGVTLNKCDVVSGQLTTLNCSNNNQVCGVDESGNPACVDAQPETCTATVCDADTNILKVCNIPDGETEGTVEEKNCADDNMICGQDDDGNPACVEATPEVCNADACSEDGNILKHCIIEDGADEGVVEEENCTKDADGNDTGLVCGLDADGNPACVEPAPESCTVSACSADGLTLRVCNIEDGAEEGVYEDQDCTKDADGNDTDLVCGKDADGNAACVAKCVADDTKCEEDTLYVCNEETGVLAITACADDSKICGVDEDGNPACVAESCTETVCDSDTNILKVCKIEDGAEAGVVEIKNCADDNMVCGVDEDGAPACVVGEVPEKCTESVCDGATLKFCNIPDGETEGTVEAQDCSANDQICGADENDAPACINKCVAADTKCADDEITLSVCDEDTGILTVTNCSESNKVCGADENDAPACVEPADNTCTASACVDGTTLNICNIPDGETIGTIEEKDCSADNDMVCGKDADGKDACVAKCTNADNACAEDGITLNTCDATGHLVPTDCSADDDKVCAIENDAPACVEKCDASIIPVCNEDGLTYEICGENGHIVVTNCADTDQVCGKDADGNTACIDKCTNEDNACSTDGLSLTKCDETGHLTTEVCGEKQYCDVDANNNPACVEAQSVVGMPCTCTGEDCEIVITGAEFKSIFSDLMLNNEVFTEKLNNIKDTDNIIGPNFYAEGNQGCEDLAAVIPNGMAVACYRDSSVVIPESIQTFLGTDLPELLRVSEDPESAKVAAALEAVNTNILAKNIDFKSQGGGYCMPVVLDASMVTEGIGASLLKENAFASDGPMAGKFNRGDHSLVDRESDSYCPAGSSLYVYELQKKFNYVGNNILNFDLCLQTCDPEASKCRDGFDCMQLQEVGLKNYTKDERPYVCFSNEAHQYFIDMKAELAKIKAML